MRREVIIFSALLISLFLVTSFVFAEQGSGDDDSDDDSSDDNSIDDSSDDNSIDDSEDSVAEVETEEEVEVETEHETEVMDSQIGAEMRIIQLEKSIRRALLFMDEVLSVLANQSVNITYLKAIRADLSLVLDEVVATSAELSSMTQEEKISSFVSLKSDARNLVKKFRDIAKPLLKEADVTELRVRFDNHDKESLAEIKIKIKEKKRELNAEHAKNILNDAGVLDEDIIAKIRSGSITDEDVRLRLQKYLSTLSQDERTEFKSKLIARVTDKKMEIRARAKNTIEEHRLRIKENSDGSLEMRERFNTRRDDRRERVANSGSGSSDSSGSSNSRSSGE